jgi:ABC-type polar amino acid transport system ATPase subunit
MAIKVRVENLVKTYGGGFRALDGISMSAEEGEVIAVIGPSGSGKSTFLRCINMLETPTSGRVFVDGAELTSPRTDINRERRKIGMVFQQFNLFPHLSAKRNIMLAPVDHRLLTKRQAEGYGQPDVASVAQKERRGAADLLGVLPQDELVYEYDCEGKPLISLPEDAPVKAALKSLLDTLALPRN